VDFIGGNIGDGTSSEYISFIIISWSYMKAKCHCMRADGNGFFWCPIKELLFSAYIS
jgi:hypothetical protein